MDIASFSIEQYFALYEFVTPHILCASDCETLPIAELLGMAGLSPADLGELSLGYTETQGDPRLREAISQSYRFVAPESVVVLAAPEEGIYLTMRTLLDPGDHVVVLTPAYDSLLNLAQHVSGNVSQWPIRPVTEGWRLDLEHLAQLVTPQTKLVVVNFPHNPTGHLPSQEDFQAIVDIVRRNDAWLLCDEMYRGLEYGEATTLPSAGELYDRSVVLAGLSKVHGLPGLRSGWLVIQDEGVRANLINWKYYTSICPPAPSEFLALAALRAQDQLIARSRRIIEKNLATATRFMARHQGMFEWRPPLAGSVAMVGLNQPSATAYCHALAKEAQVLLLPSSCMGYGDTHVRFGFGRSDFAHNLAIYEQHLASEKRGAEETA
jgi:aspartate/methionine/tyrosine aminotransferase